MVLVNSVEPVETNIIIFSLNSAENETKFIEYLKDREIHIMKLGKGKIRIVTHRNYTEEQHEYLLTTLTKMKAYG